MTHVGEEAIGYAHAVKIESLAQLRGMLKAMEKNTGAKGIGKCLVPKENCTPGLSELEIDKKTSMVAQPLAPMPDDVREVIANREETYNEPRREQKRAKVIETFPSLPI